MGKWPFLLEHIAPFPCVEHYLQGVLQPACDKHLGTYHFPVTSFIFLTMGKAESESSDLNPKNLLILWDPSVMDTTETSGVVLCMEVSFIEVRDMIMYYVGQERVPSLMGEMTFYSEGHY